MHKQTSKVGILLFLMLVVPTVLLATGEQIQFTSAAEVEVLEVNAQGEKSLARKPAVLVPPGGVVIYLNALTNTGAEPADDLVVTNPVPENTVYMSGSATETGAKLTYSVDGGKSYAQPDNLFVPDGSGGTRLAEPKEYTHIRWQMLTSLKPGETGIVEFRVLVK